MFPIIPSELEPTWNVPPTLDSEQPKAALLVDAAVPPYVRARFVSKVYALVAFQLFLTTGSVALFVFQPMLHSWALTHGAFASFLGSIWALFLACMFSCARGRHPWNALIFVAFTLAESLSIGTLCGAIDNPSLVLTSIGSGLALFASLSLTTCMRKTSMDITESTPMLILLGAGFVVLFGSLLDVSGFVMLGSALGIVAFSGFVVYDTHQLLTTLGPDDALDAALQLYLDAVNLVLCVMNFGGTDS